MRFLRHLFVCWCLLHVLCVVARTPSCCRKNGRPGPPGPPGPCPGNEVDTGEAVVSTGPPGAATCGRTPLISVQDSTVTIGSPDTSTIVEGPNVFVPGLAPVFPGESILSVQVDAATGQLRTANETLGVGNIECTCAGNPSPTAIEGVLQNETLVLTPNDIQLVPVPGLSFDFSP